MGFKSIVLSFFLSVCLFYADFSKRTHIFAKNRRGNAFTLLFGAVIIVGIMGIQVNNYLRGTIMTAQNVVTQESAETNIMNNLRQLSLNIKLGTADIDNDGFVEFPAFRACDNHPNGGGCVPLDKWLLTSDPWGTEFGYCVWDHGTANTSTGRVVGTSEIEAPIIAIISAGPNKTFETSCKDYDDPSVTVGDLSTIISPNQTGGGDDLVQSYTYEKAVASSQIGSMPDEACTADTIGQMRYEMGILQICGDSGWEEIGGGDSLVGSGLFDHVTNATLSTQYTSNAIVFDNFSGSKTIKATNGAILLVNGIDRGTSYTLTAGDEVQLRATSAAAPEQMLEFYVEVGAVKRLWRITTRDKTPSNLTITPTIQTNMDVLGPGSPAYGDVAGFIVRNIGEAETGTLIASTLSNTTNFEFYTGSGSLGDDCGGKTLDYNETCFIEVRPKASGDTGSYASSLVVSDLVVVVSADLSGSSNGWTCALPWGGMIDSGDDITAYASNNVACGASCAPETRSCASGLLSGSYQYASCNPLANCGYTWEAGSWGSCSLTCGGGTQTRSVVCRRSDGQTVADSFCGGGKPATSQACNEQACEVVVTLSNATNVTISSLFSPSVWSSSTPKRVVIPSGVTIGSSNTSLAALRTGTGWNGTLTIQNAGSIQGAGGAANSGMGGTAFLADASGVSLQNTGTIYAGGGGGGVGGTGGGGYYSSSVAVRQPSSGAYYIWGAAACQHYIMGHAVYWGAEGNCGTNGVGTASGASSYYANGWTYYKDCSAGESSGYCGVYRVGNTTTTNYTSGGAGGNGGRGQGYDGSNLMGSGGAGGGTNAGTGGTGGAGGGWGSNGAGGATGVTGNYTGGLGGGGGGSAGHGIQNDGYVTLTNSGTILGL